ncbi:IS200/IS605 family element RNA-guided endonuclease TnpB [Psychrobacter sp. Marseille-P5312]|uniref:IS200/IS605 family element RNA-guided endonuclease TnpB n=1 Tax=Psychrobacter sp. Marseille-P5312 TaxID=2086574 RepID=UPI000CF6A499|nr:IS200/IS605 family element RNA-guided endonuclease TnpB [Psychrobacter sp. Marseille-P5312]
MLKAYKYRIYPNLEQQVLIGKHFGCSRFVFNWALALQKRYYAMFGKSLTRTKIQSHLVKKKKKAKFSWLSEVNSQSLLNALLNVHTAFTNFFKGQAKFPRFKSKKVPQRSYQCPQHCTVNFAQGMINLPKVKGIKTVFSREFEGKIKTVTISKTATGKYYASVLVDNGEALPTPTTIESSLTVGIDLGISHLLNLSDGSKVDNPKHLAKASQRLAIQQKIFSRKQKTSKNYQKQKLAVARIHEKARNGRLDLHHKITHSLICENQATSYALEDLAVKNMVKNRKLAKAINDVGWEQFVTLLTYKAKWYGKNVLKVNRFFASSKICSHCDHKLDSLALSVRSWSCPNCQTTHDRDINASNNIRSRALADVAGLATV